MNENERIYWVDPEAIIDHSIGKEKLNFDIDSSTWKYDEDTKTLKEAEGPAVISLGKESESNIILGAEENLQILKNAGEGSKIILSASQVLVNGRDLAESFTFKTINNNLITGAGNFNLATKLKIGREEFIPDAVGVINIENGFPDENAIHAIKVNDEILDKNEQKEVNLYVGQISDKTLVDGEYVETIKKIFDTEEVPDIKFKTINNMSLFATDSETDIPIVGWNKSTAISGKTDLSVSEVNSVTLGNPVLGQHLDSINLNAEKIYQNGAEISFNPVYINCDAQTVDGFLIPKIDSDMFDAITANYAQTSQVCILRRYTNDHFFFFNVLGCNLQEGSAPRIYIQSVNETSDSIAIIEYSKTAEDITTNVVKASSSSEDKIIILSPYDYVSGSEILQKINQGYTVFVRETNNDHEEFYTYVGTTNIQNLGIAVRFARITDKNEIEFYILGNSVSSWEHKTVPIFNEFVSEEDAIEWAEAETTNNGSIAILKTTDISGEIVRKFVVSEDKEAVILPLGQEIKHDVFIPHNIETKSSDELLELVFEIEKAIDERRGIQYNADNGDTAPTYWINSVERAMIDDPQHWHTTVWYVSDTGLQYGIKFTVTTSTAYPEGDSCEVSIIGPRGLGDVDMDGKAYVRKDREWVPLETSSENIIPININTSESGDSEFDKLKGYFNTIKSALPHAVVIVNSTTDEEIKGEIATSVIYKTAAETGWWDSIYIVFHLHNTPVRKYGYMTIQKRSETDYYADTMIIDGFPADAPADGKIYGRQNYGWTKIDVSSEDDPFIKTSEFEEKVGADTINNQGLEATNPDNIIAAINQLYVLLAEVISNN